MGGGTGQGRSSDGFSGGLSRSGMGQSAPNHTQGTTMMPGPFNPLANVNPPPQPTLSPNPSFAQMNRWDEYHNAIATSLSQDQKAVRDLKNYEMMLDIHRSEPGPSHADMMKSETTPPGNLGVEIHGPIGKNKTGPFGAPAGFSLLNDEFEFEDDEFESVMESEDGMGGMT